MSTTQVNAALAKIQLTVKEELGKFFQVVDSLDKEGKGMSMMVMPACIVDTLWHQLDGSPEFDAWTQELTGSKFEHVNDYDKYPEARGYGQIPWVARYEEMFGMLSAVWFMDESGTMDQARYKRYLETSSMVSGFPCLSKPTRPPLHEVKGSWKCVPKRVDSGVLPDVKASWNCTPIKPPSRAKRDDTMIGVDEGQFTQSDFQASWNCTPIKPPSRA